jgi:hypothetical protein
MSFQKIEEFLYKFSEECDRNPSEKDSALFFRTDELLVGIEQMAECMTPAELLKTFATILQDLALEERDSKIQDLYLRALNSFNNFNKTASN